MVGDTVRPANSAKIDRIMIADLRFPIIRHHLPMFGIVIIAGEIKMIEIQSDIEPFHRGLQYAKPLGNDFFTNPITGDNCNI